MDLVFPIEDADDPGLNSITTEASREEPVHWGQPKRLAVSVDEASQLLGISKWLGYELVAQGKLPALRLGRRLVVPLAALERMLDGSTSGLGAGRSVQ
jgi:excisionase family DNA binding protein